MLQQVIAGGFGKTSGKHKWLWPCNFKPVIKLCKIVIGWIGFRYVNIINKTAMPMGVLKSKSIRVLSSKSHLEV